MRLKPVKSATETAADCRYIYPKHRQHLHQFVALLLYQISSLSATSWVSLEYLVWRVWVSEIANCVHKASWNILRYLCLSICLTVCPFVACQWVKYVKRYAVRYTLYDIPYTIRCCRLSPGCWQALPDFRVFVMICIKRTLWPLIADRHLTISSSESTS